MAVADTGFTGDRNIIDREDSSSPADLTDMCEEFSEGGKDKAISLSSLARPCR